MKINITYPKTEKKKYQRRRMLAIVKWPMLVLGIASIIVNICVGGKAWSVIAVFGLYMIWHLFLSIDLVEYNRISQFIKTTIYGCIMIALIDVLITPIWVIGIVSIIAFSGLLISGILFLTDIKRQKQNMLPMFVLILFTLIGSIIGLIITDPKSQSYWTIIVMGSISLLLLIVCIIVLRKDFIMSIKKRFHVN